METRKPLRESQRPRRQTGQDRRETEEEGCTHICVWSFPHISGLVGNIVTVLKTAVTYQAAGRLLHQWPQLRAGGLQEVLLGEYSEL